MGACHASEQGSIPCVGVKRIVKEKKEKGKMIMKETWIRFMGRVTQQTAYDLLQVIDKKIQEKYERIHIMISSSGGSVFYGISLYNYIKGLPVETYTYNFGSVDSIGVVLFCAGSKRFSVPNARFLVHGITLNMNEKASLDEKKLEELLKGLKIDYQNMARVIEDNTKRHISKVEEDINNRTTLNPKEAQDYGLVHEIKSELFPIDADISVVKEEIEQKR